jgi:hypothetical protein
MPQKELNRSKILRPAIHKGRLRPTNRVCPIGRRIRSPCQTPTIRAYCRVPSEATHGVG